jgi:predicted Fe-S protein YdhL (DUF1289 family)
VKSPCRSECELEGDVCTGCGRTKEQIVRWSRYTDEQREQIMEELGCVPTQPQRFVSRSWKDC